MSSLSKESSSEERNDCLDEITLSETDEEVIIQSDEDLECDEPVPQDAESISDKDCSTSSTSSAKKCKASGNGKSKKKGKRLVNMMNWNAKRTLQ